MSEPGTPSRTDTASKATRLEGLLGLGFAVIIEYIGHPVRWYEVTACKRGKYANWTMVEEDFDYTDELLIEKFITPVKGVFK